MMPVPKKLLVLLFLLLLTGYQPLWCQVDPYARGAGLWSDALKRYKKNDDRRAVPLLQELISAVHSPYESASRLLLGRIYLQRGDLNEAEKAARELICGFPHGRYAPYAHYLNAQIAFLRQNWIECAWQLLTAAQATQDDDLSLLAREKLERLFEFYLDKNQQDEILRGANCPAIIADLTAVQRGIRQPLKIGVILRLSGPQSAPGQDILSGIEHACREARGKSAPVIEIISRDSGGSVIEAVRAAQSLISEERVIALIGDLDGPCSAAIAAVASQHRVPLIVPAAQDVALAEIGESVFQLMADYRLEAAATAAYARSELEINRIAILAPASEEGAQRVRGFQARFETLGGEVSSVQWYYQEATNYRRQLEALMHHAAMRLGEKFNLTPEEVDLLSNWMDLEDEEDDEDNDEEQNEILNSIGSPINYYDAIYIPIQGDEISLLAPQIASTDFRGSLIGDAACLDPVALESNRRYVNGMVFASNFSSARNFSGDLGFASDYMNKTGEQLNRWNVLGWDAFNFLLAALNDKGKLSPRRVTRRLNDLRRFKAERLEMYFPYGTRVNHSIFILSFENGKYRQEMAPRKVAEKYFP